MARPSLDIDGELVRKLASKGHKASEIAEILDCDPKTITGRFSAELNKGRGELKMALRRAMFDLAINGKNLGALIWMHKNQMGESDSPSDTEALNSIKDTLEIRSKEELLEMAITVRERNQKAKEPHGTGNA